MVIEHTFVTTLESEDALVLASDMLSSRGFAVEPSASAPTSEGQTSLQMRRGKKSAAKAKMLQECPQQVRLEWDRGRINVAASIDPQPTRATSFGWGGVIGYGVVLFRNKRATQDATNLMLAVATSLEKLQVQHQPPEEASRDWSALESAQAEKARKARIRSRIYLGIVVVFVVGAIVLGAIVANTNR